MLHILGEHSTGVQCGTDGLISEKTKGIFSCFKLSQDYYTKGKVVEMTDWAEFHNHYHVNSLCQRLESQ